MPEYITDNIAISSDDSDREDSYEEILIKKILIKKILMKKILMKKIKYRTCLVFIVLMSQIKNVIILKAFQAILSHSKILL